MSDGEIERMTLCIAQMAATLQAGDRAHDDAPIQPAYYYVAEARALFEEAAENVAFAPAPVRKTAGPSHRSTGETNDG